MQRAKTSGQNIPLFSCQKEGKERETIPKTAIIITKPKMIGKELARECQNLPFFIKGEKKRKSEYS